MLHESLHGERLILGVDRLDYSKGLMQRFAGYRAFLADYPAAPAQVSFLQIAPPIARGRAGLSAAARASSTAGRRHQRPLRRARLGAAALYQPQLRAATRWPASIRRRRLAWSRRCATA